MTILDILKNKINVGNLHANRIEKALHHIQPFEPISAEFLENLSDENLGYLELLTGRFAKLQDFIGAKIFPLILEVLQENTQELSTLDRLHLLEKLGYINNTREWIDLRNTRNLATHEYPDDPKLMASNLEKIVLSAKSLLMYWENLKKKIDGIQ